MRKRIALVVALIAVSGWWTMTSAHAAEGGEEARKKELERLLADAADSFDAGRWVEARARLDKICAIDPSAEEAWQLRQMFGDRLLRKMAVAIAEGRDLGRGPQVLLAAAEEHERARLTNPVFVKGVVDSVVQNPGNRRDMHRLLSIGGFAAPELLQKMRDPLAEDGERTYALYLAVNMGPVMTVPLAVALEGLNDREKWADDESAFALRIVDALRQILPRDRRALPCLARLAENAVRPENVREIARRAAAEIAGDILVEAPSTAAELYYAAAERLHLEGPEVRRQLDNLRGVFFAWDQEAQGGRGALARRILPDFALNDLYAQHLAFIGMNLPASAENGGVLRFQALLARIWMDQSAEIDEFAGIAGREEMFHPAAAAHDRDVAALRRYYESTRRKAWNVGVLGLLTALGDALMAGKAPVTLGLLEAIGDTLSWDDPACGRAVAAVTEGYKTLLAALSHADDRIAQRAAVTLVKVGMPVDHPRHAELVEPLVRGALLKTPKVALVIANDPVVREDARRNLEAKGVVTIVAATGQEGCRLAWQYPLKDAILIDSEMAEFALLRQRLHSLPLVAGSELPVVIVAREIDAEKIRRQFRDGDPVWRLQAADARNVNVNADTPGLYDYLVGLNRGLEPGQRAIAILTNEHSQEARNDLGEFLRLTAERRASAAMRGELLDLLAERRLLGDAPELRTMFANVFVINEKGGDQLSGQNAMETLIALRGNPLSRSTPVALLTGERRMTRSDRIVDNTEQTKELFQEFLANPVDARLVDYRLLTMRHTGDGSEDDYTNDLLGVVEGMSKANPLVRLDTQKNFFRNTALACARALACYPLSFEQRLAAEQSASLCEALRDAARANEIRVAIADALGHWRNVPASRTLVASYRNRQNSAELRLHCMAALGETDRQGEHRDVKESALAESALALRDAAAVALAKETISARDRIPSLERLWHTEPMRVINANLDAVAVDTEFSEDEPVTAEEEGEEEEAGDTPVEDADDDW